MRQYIIKRLLLIFITLFGISIITFVITRLAPGDPFFKQKHALNRQSSQALTEENIRQNKKIYGFDKPYVLNFRFDDRDTNLKELFKSFATASEARIKYIKQGILELGTIAIPYLIKHIDKNKFYDFCVKQLQKLNIDQHPTRNLRLALYNTFSWWNELKTNKSEIIKYWKNWWSKNKNIFNKDKINKIVNEYLKTGKNEKVVKLYGAYCVSELFNGLEANLIRSTSALSSILKKSWLIGKDKSKTKKQRNVYKIEKNRIIYRWKSWWKYNEEKFVKYSWLNNFTRIFSNTQYGMWLGKIITFDFDESYTYRRPVTELIKERLPVSIQLSLFSILLTYLLAIPLGIFSATHQNKLSDKIITVKLFILYSLPSFWVASMLLLFTTGGDFPNIFPARYLHSIGSENFNFFKYMLDWLWHLVLPVFCLTYGNLAYLSRQMRVGMLDVIRQDYIKTARAKGLSEKLVIYKHALKNALIPIITILSAILPALIGGSVIIEEIFSINGMGRLAFEAILNRDYPIINAIAFFSAFLTLVGILISDILYAVVDPRIKFKGSKS